MNAPILSIRIALAARDYDRLATRLHGEFASTNEHLGLFRKKVR